MEAELGADDTPDRGAVLLEVIVGAGSGDERANPNGVAFAGTTNLISVKNS